MKARCVFKKITCILFCKMYSYYSLILYETLFISFVYIGMTKTQMVDALAAELNISKKLAGEFINVMTNIIITGTKKEWEVRIQGFGTFKKSARKAREGVNPQNPSEKIKIPAMNVVGFKAGNEFKSAVR